MKPLVKKILAVRSLKEDKEFIEDNKADLAASLQKTIIDILMDKFSKAIKETGITTVAIGGGVSANSGVRNAVAEYCSRRNIKAFIPKRSFTTDNAAMEAINGWIKAEVFNDFHITSNENIEQEIKDYIVFFNEERPAYSLNYLTPKQYREYYSLY